jgi:hypothetical protein
MTDPYPWKLFLNAIKSGDTKEMSELLATHGDHNVWSFFAFEEAATRAAGEEKDYEPLMWLLETDGVADQ